jgi:hypothetical protein
MITEGMARYDMSLVKCEYLESYTQSWVCVSCRSPALEYRLVVAETRDPRFDNSADNRPAAKELG